MKFNKKGSSVVHSIVFYPESDYECFIFGQCVERYNIDYIVTCHNGKIEKFEILGKDLWAFLCCKKPSKIDSQI